MGIRIGKEARRRLELLFKEQPEVAKLVLGNKHQDPQEFNVKVTARDVKEIKKRLDTVGVVVLKRLKGNPKNFEFVGLKHVTIAPRYNFERTNISTRTRKLGWIKRKANAEQQHTEQNGQGGDSNGTTAA